jgi:hypothetical protein
LTPARAEAIPIAAPAPSNHQAAIPAYERVVGANPPSAYERAKTAPATAIPTVMPRATTACTGFTLASGTARYSTGRVRGAEPATGSCSRRGSFPCGALRRTRLQRRSVGGQRLQGVPAVRWRREADGRFHAERDGLAVHLAADGERAQESRRGWPVPVEPRPGIRIEASPPSARVRGRQWTDCRWLGFRPRLWPDRASHHPRGHCRRSDCGGRSTWLAPVSPRVAARESHRLMQVGPG